MADRGLDHGACADRVTAYLARVGLEANETFTHELAGDASDRRYVRVVSADGSSRVLLVHADPIDPDTLPFVNVAQLLRQMPVPVPAVLTQEADLGILVLEDLGDVTLQDHLVHSTARNNRRGTSRRASCSRAYNAEGTSWRRPSSSRSVWHSMRRS